MINTHKISLGGSLILVDSIIRLHFIALDHLYPLQSKIPLNKTCFRSVEERSQPNKDFAYIKEVQKQIESNVSKRSHFNFCTNANAIDIHELPYKINATNPLLPSAKPLYS